MRWQLGALAAAAGLALLLVAADGGGSSGQTVTVVGQGSVQVVPDQATVNLGVSADASTAADALNQDSARMQAVVAAVEKAGVDKSHLQTVNLSLNPVYGQGSPATVQGFHASNELRVTLDDPAQAGPVVDAALAAGANQVGGIAFGLRDPESASRQAMTQAMANAQAAAETLAQAAGQTLGAVQSVELLSGGPPQPLPFAAAAAPAARTPVLAGQQMVSVSVRVVYALGR